MNIFHDHVKNMISELWANEDGQDLIEYTLLVAFLAIVATPFMRVAGLSINTVWSGAGTTLANAASRAAS